MRGREWMRISEMDPRHWHKVAAVSGITALGLGTYGFHMFKPEQPVFKEVWQIASLYHLIHTAALLAAPVTKRPHIFGGLLTAGILTFSGSDFTVSELLSELEFKFDSVTSDVKASSLPHKIVPVTGYKFYPAWCYTAAYLEDKSYSVLAPFGGFAFVVAWASLLF
ncbi:hypothetical protein COLO4_33018 [Corchorus olitorius]|uniref:Uncharacterized protein n=1 Tax=Corchorus olitorius TaxID=93759 RepID=A0A1R3GWN4_9ROSI|nr:hypothetical protein COLO4_33018 [Corchorus olitorius]